MRSSGRTLKSLITRLTSISHTPFSISSRHPPGSYARFLLESLEQRTLLTIVFPSVFGGDTIYWGPGNPGG
ncbi:MAG TPA: hypothetical protein VGN88_11600, partial [Phycisphaerae bacterium]